MINGFKNSEMSMLSNEWVLLRNGSKVESFVVAIIMLYLRQLHADEYPTFKELVKACKNIAYQLSEQHLNNLESYHLSENGVISDLVKSILLSALTGTEERPGLLNSPIADTIPELIE